MEYRTLQQFLERRNELPAPLRAEFARRLALKLIDKFGYQAPELGMDYQRWLDELDLAYRRYTQGLSSPSPTLTPTPTPTPLSPDPVAAPPADTPNTPVETRKW